MSWEYHVLLGVFQGQTADYINQGRFLGFEDLQMLPNDDFKLLDQVVLNIFEVNRSPIDETIATDHVLNQDVGIRSETLLREQGVEEDLK